MNTPNVPAVVPTYAVSVPMQIGSVTATTVAVDLSGVVFDSPVAFAVGAPIEFSLALPAAIAPIQIRCRGVVARCDGRGRRFEAASTIDVFTVIDDRSTPAVQAVAT